jgi:hypothetical protein
VNSTEQRNRRTGNRNTALKKQSLFKNQNQNRKLISFAKRNHPPLESTVALPPLDELNLPNWYIFLMFVLDCMDKVLKQAKYKGIEAENRIDSPILNDIYG